MGERKPIIQSQKNYKDYMDEIQEQANAIIMRVDAMSFVPSNDGEMLHGDATGIYKQVKHMKQTAAQMIELIGWSDEDSGS